MRESLSARQNRPRSDRELDENVDAALRLIGNDNNRDVVFALGVIGILVVLFAPLPAWALDMGLTFSLAFSILILMVALWIEKGIETAMTEVNRRLLDPGTDRP